MARGHMLQNANQVRLFNNFTHIYLHTASMYNKQKIS